MICGMTGSLRIRPWPSVRWEENMFGHCPFSFFKSLKGNRSWLLLLIQRNWLFVGREIGQLFILREHSIIKALMSRKQTSFQESISFPSSSSVNARSENTFVSAAGSSALAAYHFPKVWKSNGLISRFAAGQGKPAGLTCLSETI